MAAARDLEAEADKAEADEECKRVMWRRMGQE